MSGFEIAGVVLGAFPIAIVALEKYREVAKLWGFWWEIRSEYQKCSSEVKFHRLGFTRNLKQLLLPMVSDKAQVLRLLADPGGKDWREPNIAQQLEDRLQDSYELYFEIIQQLQRAMEELHEVLAVDKTDVQDKLKMTGKGAKPRPGESKSTNQLRPGKTRRDYEIYRLKFSIGEEKRKKLFAELKEYNERLEKLLTTSDVLVQLESKHGASSSTTTSGIDTTLAHFWRHTDRLYKILSRAWTCSCASNHQAKLMLQHRSFANLEFVLLFLGSALTSGADQVPWNMRETKVKMIDPPPSQTLYTTITIAPAVKENVASNENSTRSKMSILRGLKASTNSSESTKQTSLLKTSSPLDNAKAPPSPQGPSDSEIRNLCSTFCSNPPRTESYGFLEDDHKRYYIYPSSSSSSIQLTDPVTLDDLLNGRHVPPLSRRQRYALVLILSSCFLQLHDSAWLITASWTKSDISFLRDADNSNILLLDRPYITRRLTNTMPDADPTNALSSIPLLGILLLELCFGYIISAHPSRQRCPAGDEKLAPFYDMMAAIEWLREVGDEAGPDYAGAVEWCLMGSRTLADGRKWRGAFYENVIKPLERCNEYLNPGRGAVQKLQRASTSLHLSLLDYSKK